MSENETLFNTEVQRTPRRFVLPSLAISYFAIWSSGVLIGLLLLDIGRTFDQPVGVAGRIPMVTSFVTAITALSMGILSVRFQHKRLLLLGLSLVNISAIGCSIANNFYMMIITFSISGLGLAMAEPMIYTQLATHIPLEKRGWAMGWLITGSTLAPIIGAPVIGHIAELWSWRYSFISFVLPIALFGLVSAAKGVPSSTQSPNSRSKNNIEYMKGYKAVFANRSATGCFVAMVLAAAGVMAIQVYGPSFIREQFQVSIEYAYLLIIGTAVLYMVGAQVSGHLINRIGRKPLTIVTALITSIILMLYTNLPNVWLTLTIIFIAGLFNGMLFTTAYSLTLEQVPEFRGTMMSLNSAAVMFGASLGAGIGGWVILELGYAFLGPVQGALILVTALVYYLLVRDPTRNEIRKNIEQ